MQLLLHLVFLSQPIFLELLLFMKISQNRTLKIHATVEKYYQVVNDF